jgi:hypothetical protein
LSVSLSIHLPLCLPVHMSIIQMIVVLGCEACKYTIFSVSQSVRL